MGWRDRDYAKFRKDEFDAIYGRNNERGYSTRTRSGADPLSFGAGRRRRRRFRVPRALVLLATAVAATAVILGGMVATGNVPDSLGQAGGNPPVFSVAPVITPFVPTPVPRRVMRIAGTRIVHRGALTLSGHHTPQAGSIAILGRWGSEPWVTFAVADATRTSYSVKVPLTRLGMLHLRIRYPDGSSAVGTYHVE
jgi:hypothetical protein